MAEWLSIGLPTEVGWPPAEQVIDFLGLQIWLLPETGTSFPTLAAAQPTGIDSDEVLSRMRAFLSAMAWSERASYSETSVIGFGKKIPIGKPPHKRSEGWVGHSSMGLLSVPEPGDGGLRLALAFYREALSATSILYRFLSLYKVINVIAENENKQVEWINRRVGLLADPEVISRLAKLAVGSPNVGKYLYKSGRCAVAHAWSKPLADPENPKDLRRLRDDITLIRSLAEYAIENEIGGGIRSQSVRSGCARTSPN